MAERLRQSLPVIIGLVLFLAALEVLRLELQSVSWHDLTADVLATSTPRLAVAVVLTALNYLTLTGYDQLAFAYIGKSFPRRQIAAVVVRGLRGLEQRGLRDAVRRLGTLPLLHAVGRLGRGAVACRLLLLRDVLAGPAGAGWPEPRDEPARRHPGPAGPSPDPRRRMAAGRGRAALPGCDAAAPGDRCASWSYEMPLPPFRIGLGQVVVSAVGVGAGGRGALRAAAAERALVPAVPRVLPCGDSARAWPATCPAALACSRA